MNIKKVNLSCKFLIGSLLFLCSYAYATDQSNIQFKEGSVLIICAPPEGKELTEEQFNKAFPKWIALMQKRANEGIIARAHYLGTLKEGIFIVVGGANAKLAMENAIGVSEELNEVYEREVGETTIDSCRFREIGPVAILPQ